MGSLVFLALLLGVMYFILIRPQQRQVKEQQARIRSLEAGMVVVTNSGIHGAIAEVEDKGWWYRGNRPESSSRYIFVKDPDGYDIEILQAK